MIVHASVNSMLHKALMPVCRDVAESHYTEAVLVLVLLVCLTSSARYILKRESHPFHYRHL